MATLLQKEKQTKFELGQQLFYACRRYVVDNRINTDFDDQIDERKDLFLPHFQLRLLHIRYLHTSLLT
jgi:hypothetical protein